VQEEVLSLGSAFVHHTRAGTALHSDILSDQNQIFSSRPVLLTEASTSHYLFAFKSRKMLLFHSTMRYLRPTLTVNIVVFTPHKTIPKETTMQRVLVVDDDRLVADTLALVFRKSGFEARAVYSADDALACAREFAPHLLLCDVSMPARDGLTLLPEISEELPACRIIMLTGFYSNLKQVRDHASKLSRPIGILTKPCPPSELLREAAALLATA
jgi:CheY-like chemotaxis protein